MILLHVYMNIWVACSPGRCVEKQWLGHAWSPSTTTELVVVTDGVTGAGTRLASPRSAHSVDPSAAEAIAGSAQVVHAVAGVVVEADVSSDQDIAASSHCSLCSPFRRVCYPKRCPKGGSAWPGCEQLA